LENLPVAVADVLRKMLAKDPLERFQTPNELRRALEEAIIRIADSPSVAAAAPESVENFATLLEDNSMRTGMGSFETNTIIAGRYRVAYIYEDGPSDKDWVKVKVGDYLLAIEGNASVSPGLYSYDGASWHQLSTVCGGSAQTTRIAIAGPREFWTVTAPSKPRVGDGTSLCHFKDGNVVASYSTAPESPDPYNRMDAAACNAPDDCWFGVWNGFGVSSAYRNHACWGTAGHIVKICNDLAAFDAKKVMSRRFYPSVVDPDRKQVNVAG